MANLKQPERPDFLDIDDKVERKAAIEEILMQMQQAGLDLGEPEVDSRLRQDRYGMSCLLILACTVFSTFFLGACSLYFSTLPSPTIYASTQEGKLYEIQPSHVE